MGDITFNPARRGVGWRILYKGSGDGGSGEQQSAMRANPQRLDTLAGKILRIIGRGDVIRQCPGLKTLTG